VAAILVVSDRLPTPVLLHVQSRGVQAVPRERLKPNQDALVLERGDPLQGLGNFEVMEKGGVRFSYGAVQAMVTPKPSLVGRHTLAELYQHTPKYKVDAERYDPDPATVEKLRGVGGGYRVTVVFGSWCSVCKHFLPRGLAVAEALAGTPLQFEYLGLPIEDAWNTPDVKRLGVKSLPTAIVYRGEKEIGRFAGGEEWERPEARLWQVISAAGR
jgi:hypothetical protein